jgi:hypothetical protein
MNNNHHMHNNNNNGHLMDATSLSLAALQQHVGQCLPPAPGTPNPPPLTNSNANHNFSSPGTPNFQHGQPSSGGYGSGMSPGPSVPTPPGGGGNQQLPPYPGMVYLRLTIFTTIQLAIVKTHWKS